MLKNKIEFLTALFRLVVMGLFLMGFTSCQTPGLSEKGRENPRVVHVVVCWLKNPGDVQARKELIETSKTFITIPGVKEIKVGSVLLGGRPVVDSSFDVALTIEFEDEIALRNYDKHEIHQKAVREKLTPLVRKLAIYDFVEE